MPRPPVVDDYALNDANAIRLATSWGCNLCSWKVNGQELMYCPPDYPAEAFKITGGGNPLLFPAVGRTWDLSSEPPVAGPWRLAGDDKVYNIPSHGFLYLCGWRKTEETRNADSLSVAYEAVIPEEVFTSIYPFQVGFSHRYTVRDGALDLEATLTNRGDRPAPAAFGYHPYFRISSASREGVEARLPVRSQILLTPDTILPTGETIPATGVIPLKPDVYYDDSFEDLTGNRMSLIDRPAGHAIHVDFDDSFTLMTAYAPDGSEFFCIEPWTPGLGGFGHLGEPGWESGRHIPVLAPGETRRHRATFSVEPMRG
ncbi:MAG TPA: hypothetical protein VGM37_13580 [Armatimonadota bacterium]|jgi:aldose 1-epimerase